MATIILGGGVSGLLTAWHLHRRGEAVEVWEAEAEAGGWVQTLPWNGPGGEPGRVEKGPQGILVRAGSPADRLFKALDLPLNSPGKGARWVGKGDQLIPVPAHPGARHAEPPQRPEGRPARPHPHRGPEEAHQGPEGQAGGLCHRLRRRGKSHRGKLVGKGEEDVLKAVLPV